MVKLVSDSLSTMTPVVLWASSHTTMSNSPSPALCASMTASMDWYVENMATCPSAMLYCSMISAGSVVDGRQIGRAHV